MSGILIVGFVLGGTTLLIGTIVMGVCISPLVSVFAFTAYLVVGFLIGLHLAYRFGRHIRTCIPEGTDCFYCYDRDDTWIVARGAIISWPFLGIFVLLYWTFVPTARGVARLYDKVLERGKEEGKKIAERKARAREEEIDKVLTAPGDEDICKRADKFLGEMRRRGTLP